MAEIIYKDEWVCILNKAYGEDSEELAASMGLFPAHRLDKTTTGMLLTACNKNSAAFLSKCVAEGKVDKFYRATAEGVFEEKSGRMDDLLFHDRLKNKTYVVDRERNGVKKASLEYTVISENDGFSVLDIHLLTGRTHQIRAQLAHRKKPICGDTRYGAKTKGEIQLKCRKIEFLHPKKGKMEFEI